MSSFWLENGGAHWRSWWERLFDVLAWVSSATGGTHRALGASVREEEDVASTVDAWQRLGARHGGRDTGGGAGASVRAEAREG
jgi:hypothetical protein